MKAIWNDTVIAESDDIVMVENNAYFPRASLNMALVQPSETHTTCFWKGQASYFSLNVNGKLNPDAVWFYPNPKAGAEQVADRVAFWKGVVVQA
ncbi:MAG: DUF427 domain-containing protein [Brachymonas sp.]